MSENVVGKCYEENTQHYWLVIQMDIKKGNLIVECELCGKVGIVEKPTRDEWMSIQESLTKEELPNYRWNNDDSRITKIIKGDK